MKAISGKEFAKILEQYGWRLLRVNGIHHIYGKHLMKLADIEEDELS